MRVFIALLVLLPAVSIAQLELPDIDSMSIEEIEKLPPEVLKELPFLPAMRKLLSKSDAVFPEELYGLMLTMPLRDLYYTPYIEGEDDIRKAVSVFQRDIGTKVTGELTMGEYEELNRRYVRRHDTPIYASTYTNVSRFEDYSVTATGTWIIENDQIAYPVNTAEIQCYKERKTCQLIQASVVVPSLDSSDNSFSLTLDTQTYEIISWTENEVVSRPFRTDQCRSTVLTINTAAKEVYEITRNNNQEGCKFGDLLELPPLEQPQVARLAEGFEITYAYWKERKDSHNKYMNSELVERFEELLDVGK